ncbi:2-oxoglutarate dehydrogenase E1 component [Alicyclobacillus hesperidum]|uniref:oxoglutarate dehydrogenase (succinyl-transferring) n=1 Tax=Alicyclobacillus hesperidum TaxID=89784 RepID=A0A1H2Q6F9_9BACL|nr:2-oxoglutarate dehydrogenase E1 component [Alicyclobacillus hesperidum]GLV12804.1 2-oxoglutarate dehydrogenase E1 component [Alicyclobacillus hesperidum]SDW02244.1 2-oxoglutarate dehydrogenase E1 component [Alicyclobacillus hesperidum]
MENEQPVPLQSFWQQFFGPNFGYLLELYEEYKRDPNAVSAETREMFNRYGDPGQAVATSLETRKVHTTGVGVGVSPDVVARVAEYVRSIRTYGHLAADTDPMFPAESSPELEPSTYGIIESDLSQLPATIVGGPVAGQARDARAAVEALKAVYCRDLGYEFAHLANRQEREWLTEQVETRRFHTQFSVEEQKQLYRQLAQADMFERFMHRRFAGQKRFSVEGLDALVPMVDALATLAVDAGCPNVIVGMAHRGRLNILAHVLKKPYERIFAEFHTGNELASDEELAEYERGWGGDVKYHQGWTRVFTDASGRKARYVLANNPSHLEVVNPVIEGMARAAQEDRTRPGQPIQDVHKAFPILVHGDAAFPGEGVVAETLNFSQIPGYYTGGTVHIIANNHVGFTADPDQGRSTRYASDIAKGYDMPVVHVSADNPEACIRAIRLAFAFRETFHKDVVIDLVGYRRWGHNESDDPSMTQPVLYTKVASHPTVKELYATELQSRGAIDAGEIARIDQEIDEQLMEAYKKYPEVHVTAKVEDFSEQTEEAPPVSIDDLREINRSLLDTPPNFTVYPKLRRILERRRDAVDNGDIDWAHAEALAFGSILREGTPIRLTGQDSERGTFGQRHLVLHDVNNGHKYMPLQHLPGAQASFVVYNSPLSETSVIGFEYGYNIEAPETLVLWEAQFGDFANVGQPMFDQFLAAARSKWGEASGLVLLLPHGFEGQASEHSSARVERFLQLAARNNIVVANVTTSAQYFHLLRRQAARLGADARPLVVMTPKSLLRSAAAASKAADFCEGRFQPVLHKAIPKTAAKKVRRLVLSSGKVGVELTAEIGKRDASETAHIATARVEQLYPLPTLQLQEVLVAYENLKEVVWLQEEPQNQGPWAYMRPHLQDLLPQGVRLRYIGRPEQGFVAESSPDVHNRVQAEILQAALANDIN